MFPIGTNVVLFIVRFKKIIANIRISQWPLCFIVHTVYTVATFQEYNSSSVQLYVTAYNLELKLG